MSLHYLLQILKWFLIDKLANIWRHAKGRNIAIVQKLHQLRHSDINTLLWGCTCHWTHLLLNQLNSYQCNYSQTCDHLSTTTTTCPIYFTTKETLHITPQLLTTKRVNDFVMTGYNFHLCKALKKGKGEK